MSGDCARYRHVIQAEQDRLARTRTVADLRRWRDRLVAELSDPGSHYAQALEDALVKPDHPGCSPGSPFLAEWSEILATTFRRFQGRQLISADADPRDLATFALAAICGGTLIATTAGDQSALAQAIDMAIQQAGLSDGADPSVAGPDAEPEGPPERKERR